LATFLTLFERLCEPIVRLYTEQLLSGLAYLHKNGVVHRDVKVANVLVDEAGTVKLADFGASKILSRLQQSEEATSPNDHARAPQWESSLQARGITTTKGTPLYMAPEVAFGAVHTSKSDIWSVGCTVLQMLTGKEPWSECADASLFALMQRIAATTCGPPLPDFVSAEAISFLKLCFQRDPNDRPTAADLLCHSFLRRKDPERDAYASANLAAGTAFDIPERITDARPVALHNPSHPLANQKSLGLTAQMVHPHVEFSRSPPHEANERLGAAEQRRTSFVDDVTAGPFDRFPVNLPAHADVVAQHNPALSSVYAESLQVSNNLELLEELSNFAGIPIYKDGNGLLQTFSEYIPILAHRINDRTLLERPPPLAALAMLPVHVDCSDNADTSAELDDGTGRAPSQNSELSADAPESESDGGTGSGGVPSAAPAATISTPMLRDAPDVTVDVSAMCLKHPEPIPTAKDLEYNHGYHSVWNPSISSVADVKVQLPVVPELQLRGSDAAHCIVPPVRYGQTTFMTSKPVLTNRKMEPAAGQLSTRSPTAFIVCRNEPTPNRGVNMSPMSPSADYAQGSPGRSEFVRSAYSAALDHERSVAVSAGSPRGKADNALRDVSGLSDFTKTGAATTAVASHYSEAPQREAKLPLQPDFVPQRSMTPALTSPASMYDSSSPARPASLSSRLPSHRASASIFDDTPR
jgi:serine/threonine protein kinase